MPSTDVDGSPILILSKTDAILVHQMLESISWDYSLSDDEVVLKQKVDRFLEEIKNGT